MLYVLLLLLVMIHTYVVRTPPPASSSDPDLEIKDNLCYHVNVLQVSAFFLFTLNMVDFTLCRYRKGTITVEFKLSFVLPTDPEVVLTLDPPVEVQTIPLEVW